MSLLSALFGRTFDDPAQAMIKFLSDKTLDERRVVVGLLYGGPYSLKVCKWVLSRRDCDKGTAAMLLWNFGRPDGLIRGPDRFPLTHAVATELVTFIIDRWKRDLFAPAVFAWDPRELTKDYRRELKKKGLKGQDPFGIPEEAWHPLGSREPERSEAVNYHAPGNRLADLLNPLRLADLAAINPKDWEHIRRRSLGLR